MKFGQAILAIFVFLTGIFFTIVVDPLIQGMLSSIQNIGGFSETLIMPLIWVGLYALYILWIIVIPIYLVFDAFNEQPAAPQ